MDNIALIITKLMNAQIPLLIPICAVTSFLLFASENYVKELGLTAFVNEYRSTIAILFLYSATCIGWHCIEKLYRLATRFYSRKKAKQKIEESLKLLQPSEKSVIVHLYKHPENGDWMPVESPAVMGLHAKSLIYFPLNVTMLRPEKDYEHCIMCSLQPTVREILDTWEIIETAK